MYKNGYDRRSAELQWLEKVGVWLDKKYSFPGTKFRFGIDPLIGLIPFLGHAITFMISGSLVLIMLRHGGSGKLAVKMVLNVLIDTIIGAIPVLGNIFDFFWKANIRNVKLLKEHYEQGKHMGSGIEIVLLVVIAFVVLFVAIVALFVWAISVLISLF